MWCVRKKINKRCVSFSVEKKHVQFSCPRWFLLFLCQLGSNYGIHGSSTTNVTRIKVVCHKMIIITTKVDCLERQCGDTFVFLLVGVLQDVQAFSGKRERLIHRSSDNSLYTDDIWLVWKKCFLMCDNFLVASANKISYSLQSLRKHFEWKDGRQARVKSSLKK